jgi:hypothetical protein
MRIKCITFKSHQTILASLNVDYDDLDSYIVKNPVQIIAVPPRSASDPGGVGFAPYLAFTDEFDKGIKIPKSEVLTVNTPVLDLLNQYNRMFGSGIEIAPAGLKL